MGFQDDTSLTIKQRNVAWTVYEKASSQGKGFVERLNWKMQNKPMELICKCDLRKVMHGLVGGTILFAYTVITSHGGSSVAFALALTNWCCLGLETNLLRVFLFIKQSKFTMDLLFFSQVLNALVAIASVIVVCALDISETTSGLTSFREANIAIYIVMNLLNILGNVIGSVAFNGLRKRVYALSLYEEPNIPADVIPIQSP
jgi:hypothetical protein